MWSGKALLLLIALSGCGYRFTAPNSTLPAGIHAVHVPVFVNRTAEPNAEFSFTDAARDQLQRAGTLGDANADGLLEGVIVSVGSGAVLTSPSLPRQPVYRLNVSLSLSLKKNGVPVSSTSVNYSEEFPSGADVLLTESNRMAALRRVADSAVREGFDRLFAPNP